jgi:hypothetical protein
MAVGFMIIIGWLIASALMWILNAVAVAGMTTGYSFPLLTLGTTSLIFAAGICCVACVVDLVRRIRRDWLHYFGVCALLLNAVGNGLTWGTYAARWWRDLYYHLLQ